MHTKNRLNLYFYILSLALVFSLFLTACGSAETPVVSQSTIAEAQPTAVDQATPDPGTQQPVQSEGVDTGFRPKVDGFSVENYGNEISDPTSGKTSPVVNLTSIEMRRLFGDAVCAAPVQGDNTCVLIPPAQKWMDENNASMSGGHCEGLAVVSQLIYDGKINPNNFGAAKTFDLQFTGNEPLQREIAYWWATQGPVANQNKILAPKEAIDYLQKEYASNAKNLFTVGIYKEDKSGGHAITAYGVQNQGNGIYWIMVYDNNYPGQERHMTVDVNANTWEYESSINPSVEPDTYKGGPDNPIEFTPDDSRMTVFPCTFCNPSGTANKGANGLADSTPQFNEIWIEGYVNVTLQDDQGHRVGYDEKGKLVNEISGAKIQSIRAGTLSQVPPVIDMPLGTSFTANIFGDAKAASDPASIVMIGRGFYIGIDGLSMATGQMDKLAFDSSGDMLTYTTDAQESPVIVVGIEKPKADFELNLKAVEQSKGTDIHVIFDQKEDTFAFQTTSDATAKFNISITRLDPDGKQETFDNGSTPLEVGPGKLTYLYFGKWAGQGSNLEIGYDANGNGTIEDSEITNMADAVK